MTRSASHITSGTDWGNLAGIYQRVKAVTAEIEGNLVPVVATSVLDFCMYGETLLPIKQIKFFPAFIAYGRTMILVNFYSHSNS